MAGLQYQNVDVPFVRGQDDRINAMLAPADILTSALNCYPDTQGRLIKRPGTVLGGEGTVAGGSLAGSPLFQQGFGSTLLREDTGTLYGKSSINSTTKWAALGRLPSCRPTMYPLAGIAHVGQTVGAYTTARATVSGYTNLVGVAYNAYDLNTPASHYTWVGVFDLDLQVWASPPQKLSTGTLLGLVAVDDRWIVITQATAIEMRSFTFATPGTVSSTTSLVAATTAVCFDAAAVRNSSGVATGNFSIVWSGASTLYREFDHSGTAAFAAVTVDGTAARTISCAYRKSSTRFFIVWGSPAGGNEKFYARAYDSNAAVAAADDLTLDLTPVVGVHISCCWNDTNDRLEVWSTAQDITNAAYSLADVLYVGTVDNTGVGSLSSLVSGLSISSRPFVDSSGNAFCVVRFKDKTSPYVQNSGFILDSAGKVRSRLIAGSWGYTRHPAPAGAIVYHPPQLPNMELYGTNKIVGLVSKQLSSTILTDLHDLQLLLTSFDLAYVNPRAVKAGGGVLIAGGDLRFFDGARCVEHGFHLYPCEVTATAAAGGSLAAGTYSIKCVFLWTDAQGRQHRSTPSVAITGTTAGGNLTLNIGCAMAAAYYLTDRNVQEWRVEGYRTVGGSTGNYYLAAKGAITTTGFSLVMNDADATISTRPTLYTTGGVLENAALGAPVDLATRGDQVFMLTAEEPSKVFVSKPLQEATAVEFTDDSAMAINFLSDERCLGLVEHGGAPLVFTRDAAYFVPGEGPNALGQGLFGLPQKILGAPGVLDARSLFVSPLGLTWQTVRGVYRLNEQQQPELLGGVLTGAADTTVYLTSAVYWRTAQLLLYAGGTRAGVMNQGLYCYSLKAQAWFKWLPTVSMNATLASALGDSGVNQYETLYLDRYYFDPAIWTDNGTNYTMTIQTGWIRLDALSGYQRLKEIGVLSLSYASFTLNINTEYDYADGTVNAANHAMLSGPQVMGLRLRPTRQKCAAVRVVLTSLDATQGAIFTGLTLRIAGKFGMNKNWTQT